MAGDGESLESCLSKFLLKLCLNLWLKLMRREVFSRVLHICRCVKCWVYLHDITLREVLRQFFCGCQKVLRQLLSTEGFHTWLFVCLLNSSWFRQEVCMQTVLGEILLLFFLASVIEGFAVRFSLKFRRELAFNTKNKRCEENALRLLERQPEIWPRKSPVTLQIHAAHFVQCLQFRCKVSWLKVSWLKCSNAYETPCIRCIQAFCMKSLLYPLKTCLFAFALF